MGIDRFFAGCLPSCGDEPRQSDQVVGSHRQGELEAKACRPAQHRSGKAADGLAPAERFLDALALLLAHRIARVPRCAAVDRRTAARVVLRDVRRDAQRAQVVDERGRVVPLVGAERQPPPPGRCRTIMASAASRSAYPDAAVSWPRRSGRCGSPSTHGRDRRAWPPCPGPCDRAWPRHLVERCVAFDRFWPWKSSSPLRYDRRSRAHRQAPVTAPAQRIRWWMLTHRRSPPQPVP